MFKSANICLVGYFKIKLKNKLKIKKYSRNTKTCACPVLPLSVPGKKLKSDGDSFDAGATPHMDDGTSLLFTQQSACVLLS